MAEAVTTNRPAFVSEEELVKQLQDVLRSVTSVPNAYPTDEQIADAQAIVEELSMRIYNNAELWGIADVPAEFRDDVVIDTFNTLLFSLNSPKLRTSVIDWFKTTAEAKFHRAWALAERQKAEAERITVAAEANPRPRETPEDSGVPADAPAAFSLPDDGWSRFEAEFPRDAFALRLRYLLKQTPEQMATMLDAPSSRAIAMRLTRARDRFRMFCEQQGISRTQVGAMLSELSEDKR